MRATVDPAAILRRIAAREFSVVTLLGEYRGTEDDYNLSGLNAALSDHGQRAFGVYFVVFSPHMPR